MPTLRPRPSASCRAELREGDLCLVLGAGDIDELGRAARGVSGPGPAGVEADYPLARLTTVRTGGPAEFFARAGDGGRLG